MAWVETPREVYLKESISKLTDKIILLENELVHAKEERENRMNELVELRAVRTTGPIITGS